MLPRRPSHWRNALDETARSLGFKLEPIVEAYSLTVQKELVACTPRLYSILWPFAVAAELQSGRLQATRLVRPDLTRHVTLALPKHGKLSPACRVVSETVQQLVESWGQQLAEPASVLANVEQNQRLPLSAYDHQGGFQAAAEGRGCHDG